ncbi:MAG: hypothetical protein ABI237_03070 [Ginsengibacter sp.]
MANSLAILIDALESIVDSDYHFTVPWYLNVNEVQTEVEALETLMKNELGDAVELFVHADGLFV